MTTALARSRSSPPARAVAAMAAGYITTPGWLEEELCTSSYSIEWPATALAIDAGTAAAATPAPITGSAALSS